MILYVESNFLLEIALAREGEMEARRIVDRAENGQFELAVPIFSLCEPYSTVRYLARNRARDFAPARRQLQDLGRGEANREIVEAMDLPLTDVLNIEIRERGVLAEVVGRLLGCATVLPLSRETFDASQQHQATHGLDASDALIYAAVLIDARTRAHDEPKAFATRNSKDFDVGGIRDELASAGCDLTFSFEGLGAE